jgi:hypothetical protein
MWRLWTNLGVGYAGTALLILATFPVVYSAPNRRVGALLCIITLMMVFVASLTIDATKWRGTFTAAALRSAKWYGLGFSALLLALVLAGEIPNS